jgi:hypothetical protein
MHGAISNNHDVTTETLLMLAQKRWQVGRTDFFLAVIEKFDAAGRFAGHRPHGPQGHEIAV